MSSIFVYGTTWCGYTRQQVSELKDELTKHGHNVSQSMRFIECDKEENDVCKGLSGYPLAMVHSDDKPPSETEVAAVSLGKRPVKDLMREWHTACGTGPEPAPPSGTVEPLPAGDPAIYVYGTTWCGYTRQQVAEVKDALSAKGADVDQSLHFVECDKVDNKVCKELSGYPLAIVHGEKPPSKRAIAKAPLGKRPAEELLRELHDARSDPKPDRPKPDRPKPDRPKPDRPDKDPAIYVYGTTWCGYTQQQVAEVKDALNASDLDADSALHFVECDKVDNKVCKELQGYPLAIVHGEKPPSKHAIAKAPLGKRSAEDLLQELHDARGDAPSDDSEKDPGIYVYGTTWCGYTRKQVAEVEDALKQDSQLDNTMLHYIQCDKDGKDDPVCQSLQAFPLTMVHRGPPTPEQAAKHEPGKQPADHLLKKLHRKLKHPPHHS